MPEPVPATSGRIIQDFCKRHHRIDLGSLAGKLWYYQRLWIQIILMTSSIM